MKAAKIRLAGVVVALFSGALFATDYYVDANNGNDAWDGSSATRGEGDVGPKQTLVAAMAISGLASGDVVHAAEGYYTNGVVEVGVLRYRVAVPATIFIRLHPTTARSLESRVGTARPTTPLCSRMMVEMTRCTTATM